MAKSRGKKPTNVIRGPSPGGGAGKVAKGYTHPDQTLLMRPEVGTQAQFRKKKPPQTYRYDSSLSPALDWDGGNGARELGEWLLGVIERAAGLPAPHVLPSPAEFKASDGRVTVSVHSLQEAVDQLKRLGPVAYRRHHVLPNAEMDKGVLLRKQVRALVQLLDRFG